MTVALVSTSPRAIVATYPDVPNPLPLPSGDEVAGAQIGWTGEGFALVAVAAEAYRLAAERLHGQFART